MFDERVRLEPLFFYKYVQGLISKNNSKIKPQIQKVLFFL